MARTTTTRAADRRAFLGLGLGAGALASCVGPQARAHVDPATPSPSARAADAAAALDEMFAGLTDHRGRFAPNSDAERVPRRQRSGRPDVR